MTFKEFFLIETTSIQRVLNSKNVDPSIVQQAISTVKQVLTQQFTFTTNNPKLLDALTKWIVYYGLWDVAVGSSHTPHLLSNKLVISPEVRVHIPNFFSGWTRRTMRDIGDFIAAHINDGQLLNNLNRVDYKLSDLENDASYWHQRLKNKSSGQGAIGKVVVTLDDVGMKGWTWVNLERRYCELEKTSMGHCGNSGGKPDDTIISLRDPHNKPHLTFIVNNKILGESKGKGNIKPAQRYHKAIIKLLLSPVVESIKGGGYLPENNFHLSDLSEQDRKLVLSRKPNINYSDYIFRSPTKELLSKEFNMDIFGINGNEVIIEKFDGLEDLYNLIKSSDVSDFSWIEGNNPMDFDVSDREIESYLDNIDSNNIIKIKQILGNIEDWQEELFNDENDLANDIKDNIRIAIMSGLESGYISDAYKYLTRELSQPTNKGFYVDFTNQCIEISLNSLKELYEKDPDYFADNGERLDSEYDFEFDTEHKNFYGFDEDSFNEYLGDLLSQLS